MSLQLLSLQRRRPLFTAALLASGAFLLSPRLAIAALPDSPTAAASPAAIPAHLRPLPALSDDLVSDGLNAEDLRAGGDSDKRYILLREASAVAPAEGFKLLLVLPGGDGSPDFYPFIRRFTKQAIGPGWVVVQMIAPVWSSDSERVVWPTRSSPQKGMKFTTEAYIADVVADVARHVPIDHQQVYALGWSSGGPPVYTAALSSDSVLSGAFVAMSIFHPAELPPLTGAKTKRFYLLHSPTDFIPIRQAEKARSLLAANGAETILTTYHGGHGWTEDPYGNIRRGVVWLIAKGSESKP